jgi:hypothetical protein
LEVSDCDSALLELCDAASDETSAWRVKVMLEFTLVDGPARVEWCATMSLRPTELEASAAAASGSSTRGFARIASRFGDGCRFTGEQCGDRVRPGVELRFCRAFLSILAESRVTGERGGDEARLGVGLCLRFACLSIFAESRVRMVFLPAWPICE